MLHQIILVATQVFEEGFIGCLQLGNNIVIVFAIGNSFDDPFVDYLLTIFGKNHILRHVETGQSKDAKKKKVAND